MAAVLGLVACLVVAAGFRSSGLTGNRGPAAVSVPALSPSLRSLAARDGISFGAAVDTSALAGNASYAAQLADQYDMVTAENVMKWRYTEPRPGHFDFGPADRLVSFARQHGMTVRGHTLVWYEENPGWLSSPGLLGARLASVLRRHITTEVGHFRGRIAQWDVVNEAVDDQGGLRSDVWLEGLGPSYIADAFRWAHAADSGAVLFYNDYGIEAPGPKADAVYDLLASLRAQGVPVGGVGFEVHVRNAGAFEGEELAAEMARFAGLGLQTAVTEMDVRLRPPAPAAALDQQASDFGAALASCRSQPSCRTFTTWGYTDLDSWIPATYPGFGQALPFDAHLRPKPAALALQAELENPS